MAKESKKAKERKNLKLFRNNKEKRDLLKEKGDYEALDKLPKNSSRVRLHNRCRKCGRPRGYIRYFGLCRVDFRELASEGKIPGVVKASW